MKNTLTTQEIINKFKKSDPLGTHDIYCKTNYSFFMLRYSPEFNEYYPVGIGRRYKRKGYAIRQILTFLNDPTPIKDVFTTTNIEHEIFYPFGYHIAAESFWYKGFFTMLGHTRKESEVA